ncbi:MAG: GNAT family N-acetyltransferase [Clostridia bacterium]|nr:GNAT family N-acetyltransferase [Clostridia bacterium]
MIFRRFRAEYSDGVIDLIPLHISPPAKELEFGHEQIWSITLHNQRREIGQISYRTGESRAVYYFGHIGYHVDPAYRGHHYAARACQLLRKEILLSGKCSVVITCDPDNLPSRKTCQSLGCRMESVCSVPEKMQRDFELSPAKCRYIWKMKEER